MAEPVTGTSFTNLESAELQKHIFYSGEKNTLKLQSANIMLKGRWKRETMGVRKEPNVR
jgi:hypothetical protein